MELKEALKLAIQSLWANKLRTVLTLLGVVIGVTSVIAVVTLVNGANSFVIQKFSRYGADVFTVSQMPALVTNADGSKTVPVLWDSERWGFSSSTTNSPAYRVEWAGVCAELQRGGLTRTGRRCGSPE